MSQKQLRGQVENMSGMVITGIFIVSLLDIILGFIATEKQKNNSNSAIKENIVEANEISNMLQPITIKTTR